MNVLLTSAGRRNYLVQYFREALGAGGRVAAADSSPYAPALAEADMQAVLPAAHDESYADALREFCEAEGISAVIPLSDMELPVLASHRKRFAQFGIVIVVSNASIVETCFDKFAASRFFKKHGIHTPETLVVGAHEHQAVASASLTYPVVVKPRRGAASIGIERVGRPEELEATVAIVKRGIVNSAVATANGAGDVIVQDFVEGAEYGLDVINDLEGSYVGTLARRKLRMRAGETDQAESVVVDELSALGRKLGESLGHIGMLDCDVIVTTKGAVVLEMNPRFGGGYPFSHMAGARLPDAIIAWLRGEPPVPGWFSAEPGVVSAKTERLVVVGSA